MNNVRFVKYSGAGNDFVIFLSEDLPTNSLSESQIKHICDRRFGVGGDGVIVLAKSDKADFEMLYYNSDGKLGSLCGNGARCAIMHAYDSKLFAELSVNFIVGSESFSGKVLNHSDVKLKLNNPHRIKPHFKIKAFNQLIESAYADTGSPHVIININDVLIQPENPKSNYSKLEDFPVNTLGLEIRNHSDFAPTGTNVNFISVNGDSIGIRTFERGVEEETLACGTGSVAAAIISNIKYGLESPVKLKTFGGIELQVEFKKSGDDYTNINLIGPAIKVFEGKILL
jgi:diaminopimelate epimerase